MKIRITQDLVFRGHKNNYLFTIHKGTVLDDVVDMGTYFVTAKGGVYPLNCAEDPGSLGRGGGQKDECEVLE